MGGIVSDFYGPWVGRKKNVEESKQDINMSVLLPSIFFILTKKVQKVFGTKLDGL